MNTTNYPGMPIPWYRTRLFWGVVFSLLLAWSISFYFFAFHSAANSLEGHIIYILYTLGSAFFSMWGFFFLGKAGGYIATILYFVLMVFLGLHTFKSSQVKLYYPIFFLLSFFIGTYMAMLFLGSFA